MKLRKVASLTALLTFVMLTVTGIILYVVPQGRVAYWSEWRLWGLTKEDWAAMHILVSLLFLVVGIIHVVLNWGPIVFYLKDRAKQRLRVFTPEFTLSLALTLLFALGAVYKLPPMRWVMDLNTFAKDQGAKAYGEPPYGHAEQSSLKTFAERTNMDLTRALGLLKAAGIRFEGPEQKLQDIAKANGMNPQQVYLAMKAAEKPKPAPTGILPEEAATGLGRKTLAGLCQEYGLEVAFIQQGLAARKISAEPDQTIKRIAEDAALGPHDLYGVIREISLGK